VAAVDEIGGGECMFVGIGVSIVTAWATTGTSRYTTSYAEQNHTSVTPFSMSPSTIPSSTCSLLLLNLFHATFLFDEQVAASSGASRGTGWFSTCNHLGSTSSWQFLCE
jgi:hypothetical protein